MKFYKAKKIVIVAEKILKEKICEIIEKNGAHGYTVVRAGGKGEHHMHYTPERASVVADFGSIKIDVIVNNQSTAENIATQILEQCFVNYSGIVYLEDVEVLRPSKFED
ncbi:MAG: hypothetical protein MI700_03065 [Balneolales bacterium]|nr:hypothetical protein [Balneolales bacterium]